MFKVGSRVPLSVSDLSDLPDRAASPKEADWHHLTVLAISGHQYPPLEYYSHLNGGKETRAHLFHNITTVTWFESSSFLLNLKTARRGDNSPIVTIPGNYGYSCFLQHNDLTRGPVSTTIVNTQTSAHRSSCCHHHLYWNSA
jgi:hypothetical protein